MSPCEHPSTHRENQAKGTIPQQKTRARRPRSRACLLKGCGRVFRPNHPLSRYCSEHCRNQAAKWRKWKAGRQYRQTANGKQVRSAQSRRYRMRRKERKKQKAENIAGARAITRKFFFHAPAIVRGDMRNSNAGGGRRCSVFAPMPVGALWNGFWSVRGVGGSAIPTGDELL